MDTRSFLHDFFVSVISLLTPKSKTRHEVIINSSYPQRVVNSHIGTHRCISVSKVTCNIPTRNENVMQERWSLESEQLLHIILTVALDENVIEKSIFTCQSDYCFTSLIHRRPDLSALVFLSECFISYDNLSDQCVMHA